MYFQRMSRVLCLALVGVCYGHAADIVVTNDTDVPAAGKCRLRDAIDAANNDAATNGCAAGSGADTIRFDLPGPSTITLTATLPFVTSPITIDGSGQNVTISGGGTVRVLFVDYRGVLTLRSLTVGNGYATNDGGGVFNRGSLQVIHCRFSGNSTAGVGGAIVNFSGSVSITDTTFSNNSAEGSGGGIHTALGAFSTTGSTFYGNRGNDGGALLTWTDNSTISRTTFSGNTAMRYGGAVVNAATSTITDSTFSGNSASFGGGLLNADTVNLGNTIIANSSGGDCVNDERTINAISVNLVEDGSCAIAGALSGDPNLGPLADNGGPTMTHALLASPVMSPAIDKGSYCASTDQRGQSRPVDGDRNGTAVCDIGAYEYANLFQFTGFLAPVANPPAMNTVKAGQAVPIKFRLGGDQGLNIFAPGFPRSQPMACTSGVPLAEVAATATPGASALSYDSSTQTYTYVWKTEKGWTGCRQLIVQLIDGTIHTAGFELK